MLNIRKRYSNGNLLDEVKGEAQLIFEQMRLNKVPENKLAS